ncbi:MAG: hypothetical protein NVS1B4_15570 [Gemmatimonadaceae bacterium]
MTLHTWLSFPKRTRACMRAANGRRGGYKKRLRFTLRDGEQGVEFGQAVFGSIYQIRDRAARRAYGLGQRRDIRAQRGRDDTRIFCDDACLMNERLDVAIDPVKQIVDPFVSPSKCQRGRDKSRCQHHHGNRDQTARYGRHLLERSPGDNRLTKDDGVRQY